MIKEPVAGRVKTRLGREVGIVTATWFYRHMATAVVRRLASTSRWHTSLAVTPDPAVHRATRLWGHSIATHAQGAGDLGRRMQRIMDLPTASPLLIVGTDIPGMTRAHVARAFKSLAGRDAVLGPTPDGGYWLVGMARRRHHLQPFDRVRWSSAHALADTRSNLQRAGASIGSGPLLSDVDDAEAWRSVRSWAGRTVLPLAK